MISPVDNYNYSTSYMFSYGPFSHTGFKVDYASESGFSAMAGVFNPTDATEFNPINEYAGGLQLAYDNNGLGVYLNGLFSDGFTQLDITAGYDVSDELYIGLNATTASDSFNGVAGYVQYAATDVVSFGLRAESFMDRGLGLFSELEEENVFATTLSANIAKGNLTIIPEIRLDSFDSDIVLNDGELGSSLTSFVLAIVYGF